MSTDQRCVQWANEIIASQVAPADEQMRQMIWCLTQEQFYFNQGAARNALVHVGEPAVPWLLEALKSPQSSQSEGAALTLGAIGPKAHSALPALKEILTKKPMPGMLQPDAAQAIGKIGDIDYLISVLQGHIPGVSRYLASQGLGAAGPSAVPAIPYLINLINGTDSSDQMYAADALGQIGPAASAAIPRLGELSKSQWNFVRHSAGEALAKIGTPEAAAAARTYRLRTGLFNSFFKLMVIFQMPLLPAAVGFGFALWGWIGLQIKGRKMVSSFLFVPAAFWILYSLYEYECQRVRYNIRIDLLFIYPLLGLVSVVGAAVWLGSALIQSRKTKPHQ